MYSCTRGHWFLTADWWLSHSSHPLGGRVVLQVTLLQVFLYICSFVCMSGEPEPAVLLFLTHPN